MKVTKEKNEFGLNITMSEGKKSLHIYFGGNGDLYWAISREGEGDTDYNHDSFKITKENYGIYRLFEKMFFDIENLRIFGQDEPIPPYLETEEEIREYLKNQAKRIEKERERYRLFNRSNYNDLFNAQNGTVTWYSDETAAVLANYVRIKKEKDAFILEFNKQPYVDGYVEDFHSEWDIPIRFSNSGSKYEPFNTVFMRMYNAMDGVDDVNDEGHQIHIEEYLYNQDKAKTLVKKISE